jgi:hypothetical protein
MSKSTTEQLAVGAAGDLQSSGNDGREGREGERERWGELARTWPPGRLLLDEPRDPRRVPPGGDVLLTAGVPPGGDVLLTVVGAASTAVVLDGGVGTVLDGDSGDGAVVGRCGGRCGMCEREIEIRKKEEERNATVGPANQWRTEAWCATELS